MRRRYYFTARAADYRRQLQAAEREQCNHINALKEAGWLWNPVGFYYHPEKPGTEIWL